MSYQANDERYMGSDADILARLAQIRRNRGLPPDSQSDQVWLRRIKDQGVEAFATARDRIAEKAQTDIIDQMQHSGDIDYLHSDDLILERLEAIRENQGLDPDAASNEIWLERILTGGALVFDEARRRMSEVNVREEEEIAQEQEQATATALIENMLSEYDLGFSEEQIQDWVERISDDPQAMMPIIEEEIRQSDEFKARFPGMDARIDAGYNAISVEEYLSLEDSYRQVLRRSGMPSNFYSSTEDMAEFIAHDVSAQELEHRVVEGLVAAESAPAEVRDALYNFYGIENSTSALAAYFLDPEKGLPAIEREFESAQIQGAARRTGFGGIGQQRAEDLQGLGIDPMEAQQGFTELTQQRQIMGAGPGEVGGDAISRDAQMDAVFRGDAFAQDRIRRQQERRMSAFGGEDAGAIQTQTGLSGLRGTST